MTPSEKTPAKAPQTLTLAQVVPLLEEELVAVPPLSLWKKPLHFVFML